MPQTTAISSAGATLHTLPLQHHAPIAKPDLAARLRSSPAIPWLAELRGDDPAHHHAPESTSMNTYYNLPNFCLSARSTGPPNFRGKCCAYDITSRSMDPTVTHQWTNGTLGPGLNLRTSQACCTYRYARRSAPGSHVCRTMHTFGWLSILPVRAWRHQSFRWSTLSKLLASPCSRQHRRSRSVYSAPTHRAGNPTTCLVQSYHTPSCSARAANQSLWAPARTSLSRLPSR